MHACIPLIMKSHKRTKVIVNNFHNNFQSDRRMRFGVVSFGSYYFIKGNTLKSSSKQFPWLTTCCSSSQWSTAAHEVPLSHLSQMRELNNCIASQAKPKGVGAVAFLIRPKSFWAVFQPSQL